MDSNDPERIAEMDAEAFKENDVGRKCGANRGIDRHRRNGRNMLSGDNKKLDKRGERLPSLKMGKLISY